VSITVKVEGSIPPHDEVYRIKLRDIVGSILGVKSSSRYIGFPSTLTNLTRQDITEMFKVLKVKHIV